MNIRDSSIIKFIRNNIICFFVVSLLIPTIGLFYPDWNVLMRFGWMDAVVLITIAFIWLPFGMSITTVIRLIEDRKFKFKEVFVRIIIIWITYVGVIFIMKPCAIKWEMFEYTDVLETTLENDISKVSVFKKKYVNSKRKKIEKQIIDYLENKYNINREDLVVRGMRYSFSKNKDEYGIAMVTLENIKSPDDYFIVKADVSKDGVTLIDFRDNYYKIDENKVLENRINDYIDMYFDNCKVNMSFGSNVDSAETIATIFIGGASEDFEKNISHVLYNLALNCDIGMHLRIINYNINDYDKIDFNRKDHALLGYYRYDVELDNVKRVFYDSDEDRNDVLKDSLSYVEKEVKSLEEIYSRNGKKK